jgi:hypothetical protein
MPKIVRAPGSDELIPPGALLFLQQQKSRLRKEEVNEIVIYHNDDCQGPKGGPCSCTPIFRLAGDRPERN